MKIKISTISYLVLLACFITLSACGNFQLESETIVQATATSDPFLNRNIQSDGQDVLVASLELPDTLPANKPVMLQFTLKNRSDRALYFLKWYTPLEGISGKIFRVARDGQLLPYEGILAMRAAPSPEDYIHLEPGESVSAEVDLANTYDFSQPGKYTIAFLSPNISHIAYSDAEMAKSVDDLYPVNISSNEVDVEITKPVTGQAANDCQFIGRVQLDVQDAGDSSPEEVVASLWTIYLEQFQSPLFPDRCRLNSFNVENVTFNPEEGQLIPVGPDEYIALVDYAVQVDHREETIWMAGSGKETESSNDGWIGKTVLVKVTKGEKVYTITIQGFG